MLGDVRTLTLLEAPLAHLLLGLLLPSHCGLKELPELRGELRSHRLGCEHLRSCNPRRAKCAQLLSCGLRNRFGALSPFNPRPSRLGIRFPRRTDSTPINSDMPQAATVKDPASL